MITDSAFSLAPSLLDLQAQAEEIAERFAPRHREVRLHPLERGELHPELWEELARQGWPGLLVPAAHGGAEGGLLAWVVVMEALAASNLVLWMPVLTTAIAHAVAEVGPDPVREQYLERVASGETLFALAVTEPESGHNVFRTRTTVRRDGERFLVNGVKAVTSGIDLAERVLVLGRAPVEGEPGPAATTAVLVDPRAPGVQRSEIPMRGREGVRQFELRFDDAEAPLDALVGAEGQGLLALWPMVNVERLLVAALCIGNVRYCISRAVARAGERNVFGERPIGAEQAIQHPLAMLHARLEATRLLVYRAAARFDAGADSFVLAGEANIAKLLTAELLFDAADHALQTLGGAGWDEREGMLDVFLDARLARSAPISQELALNHVAQHVLGLPRSR